MVCICLECFTGRGLEREESVKDIFYTALCLWLKACRLMERYGEFYGEDQDKKHDRKRTKDELSEL